jgi:hypothetical protein
MSVQSISNLMPSKAYLDTIRNGGISVNHKGETPPSTGFMVGGVEDDNKSYTIRFTDFDGFSFAFQQLLTNLSNRTVTERECMYVGTWLNENFIDPFHQAPLTIIELELSMHISSLQKAMKLGKAFNQLYIYDLAAGKSIKVEKDLPQAQ